MNTVVPSSEQQQQQLNRTEVSGVVETPVVAILSPHTELSVRTHLRHITRKYAIVYGLTFLASGIAFIVLQQTQNELIEKFEWQLLSPVIGFGTSWFCMLYFTYRFIANHRYNTPITEGCISPGQSLFSSLTWLTLAFLLTGSIYYWTQSYFIENPFINDSISWIFSAIIYHSILLYIGQIHIVIAMRGRVNQAIINQIFFPGLETVWIALKRIFHNIIEFFRLAFRRIIEFIEKCFRCIRDVIDWIYRKIKTVIRKFVDFLLVFPLDSSLVTAQEMSNVDGSMFNSSAIRQFNTEYCFPTSSIKMAYVKKYNSVRFYTILMEICSIVYGILYSVYQNHENQYLWKIFATMLASSLLVYMVFFYHALYILVNLKTFFSTYVTEFVRITNEIRGDRPEFEYRAELQQFMIKNHIISGQHQSLQYITIQFNQFKKISGIISWLSFVVGLPLGISYIVYNGLYTDAYKQNDQTTFVLQFFAITPLIIIIALARIVASMRGHVKDIYLEEWLLPGISNLIQIFTEKIIYILRCFPDDMLEQPDVNQNTQQQNRN